MKATNSIIIFKRVAALLLVLLAGSGWLTGPAYAAGKEFQVPCNPEFGGLFLAGVIDQANSNPGLDKIILTKGCIYTLFNVLNRTNAQTGLPTLTEDLIIEGNGAIIERSAAPNTRQFRLLEASGPIEITLKDVTLTGGQTPPGQSGGAISTGFGVKLSLIHVNFINNKADLGGAVEARGPLTVVDNKFIQNRALAGHGGGILAQAALSILQTRFSDNEASDVGGAVAAVGSATFVIANSKFIQNHAKTAAGGAVYAHNTISVLNAVFDTNTAATDGGAIYSEANLHIESSILKRNSAGGSGGSLYGRRTATLIGNTFYHNRATEAGSGLFLAQVQGGISDLINNLWADNYKQIDQPRTNTLCLLCLSNSKGRVTVNHNTLANAAPLREKAIEVGQGEARITNSIIVNYDTGILNEEATVTTAHNLYFGNRNNEVGVPPVTSHILDQDPRFVDPAKGRYTLQANSPALGKAEATASEPLDRRGVHRPQGSGPDIGADEFDEGFIPASHVISLPACAQGEGDVETLVNAFLQANDEPGADRLELGANCVYTLETPSAEFNGPTGLPVVSEYLVVEGNGATIQRSENAVDFRLMAVDDALIDLRDLTLQQGQLEKDGAGLYVDNFDGLGEALTLTNVTFRDNTSIGNYYGGGLYTVNSTVTIIERSRFENNEAEEGGGAYLEVTDLRLNDTRFSTNTADYGGGLYIYADQGTIERSHFENNQVLENEGGGIYVYSGSVLKVTRSAFISNSAVAGGGGIFAEEESRLTLDGNTLVRNDAPVGAGLLFDVETVDNLIANNLWVDNVTVDDEASAAITLRDDSSSLEGQVDVFHNTIVSSGQAEGEGVWIGGPVVRLRNNIIANHNAGILLFETGAATAEHNLYAGNRFETAGNVQRSNELTTDQPIFIAPARGDFHLRPGSAAIDKGLDAGLTTDLDGASRPFGEGFDIGAYEFGSTPPDPGPNPNPNPNPNPGGFSVFLPLVVK